MCFSKIDRGIKFLVRGSGVSPFYTSNMTSFLKSPILNPLFVITVCKILIFCGILIIKYALCCAMGCPCFAASSYLWSPWRPFFFPPFSVPYFLNRRIFALCHPFSPGVGHTVFSCGMTAAPLDRQARIPALLKKGMNRNSKKKDPPFSYEHTQEGTRVPWPSPKTPDSIAGVLEALVSPRLLLAGCGS